MRRRSFAALAAAAWLCLAASEASAGCTLEKVAELPVTMSRSEPVALFQINGRDAPMIIDSGAFYSTIAGSWMGRLKLSEAPHLPLYVDGIGGRAQMGLTRVKTFGFAGQTVHDIQFLTGGDRLLPREVAGLIGQNVLRAFDVEYDLAALTVRLMSARDCDGMPLAYWGAGKAVGAEPLLSADAANPHMRGDVTVNGVQLTAMFDTGAPTSVVSIKAARRAGIDIKGAGVQPAGLTGGVGSWTAKTWIVPVERFSVGGEEVRHTRLRVADTDLAGPDMLIGADFFRSHRVYVANARRMMFFTYNGGPVFDLSKHAEAAQNPPADGGAPARGQSPVDQSGPR